MALLAQDGNPNKVLHGEDFTSQGYTKNIEGDLALVVGCAVVAESWISSQQWSTMWRKQYCARKILSY